MILQIRSEKSDGNSYIVEEDGFAVIIDPGQGRALPEEIRGRGLIPEYILLTHEHFDHVENLEEVRGEYGVPVIACELCSERIQKVSTNLSGIADLLAYFKTGEVPEEKTDRFTCKEADITFSENFELEWRGHMFRFRRSPGHSPGSVIITMDETDAFTGDYMILGRDETLRLKGGSAEDFEEMTKPVLISMPAGTGIHPGHGDEYAK